MATSDTTLKGKVLINIGHKITLSIIIFILYMKIESQCDKILD